MTNERSLAMVFGYLREIDKANEWAQKFGLQQRFAVALDSYREGRGEAYFDHKLLYRVLQAVQGLIDHNSIRIEYNEDPFRHIAGGGQLAPADIVFDDGRDPFDALLFLKGDKVTGFVQLQHYYAVGGPFPYHDTYCFTFYVAGVDEGALLSRIEAVAATEGFLIRDVVHGEPQPHISLLTKLKRLL